MASYCLTEPGSFFSFFECFFIAQCCALTSGSGSDAASLATKAVLDETTNEYVIDGGKAFISGAGTAVDTRGKQTP
jgi:hypothetical protein